MSPPPNQAFECAHVPPEIMDRLWATGWRHFGTLFFRYSEHLDDRGASLVTPLRLVLDRFSMSKSQRRVLRKNTDLRCEFVPAALTDEARAIFDRHKERFRENVPESLASFLSPFPSQVPCECVMCCVWDGEALAAVSYLDVGAEATSAVYGAFDPCYAGRSLGIYTMLQEIEFSRQRGCAYYYPGYATREPGVYDYKKQFRGLEVLTWEEEQWRPLEQFGLT